MPEFRYALPGLPAAGARGGVSAFTPHFGGYAASGIQQYKYNLVGRPGTEAIPAPIDDNQLTAHVDGPHDLSDLTQMGSSRSVNAPPLWYPQQYYQTVIAERPGAGMPIIGVNPGDHLGDGNVLPVPAEDVGLRLRRDQAMSPPTGVVQRVRQLPWWPRLYAAPGGQ